MSPPFNKFILFLSLILIALTPIHMFSQFPSILRSFPYTFFYVHLLPLSSSSLTLQNNIIYHSSLRLQLYDILFLFSHTQTWRYYLTHYYLNPLACFTKQCLNFSSLKYFFLIFLWFTTSSFGMPGGINGLLFLHPTISGIEVFPF